MVPTDTLSNRQQLILSATNKMLKGTQMYEEGLLEFQQLTGDNLVKKHGSGGQDVSEVVKQIAKRSIGTTNGISAKTKKKSKKKTPFINEHLLTEVMKAINSDQYATTHVISKKLKIAWATAKAATDILVNKKQVERVNKLRPGSHVTSKCFVPVP